jgi:integrase/recombinase XerD
MDSYIQIILDKRRKRADGTYPVSFRIIHNRIPATIKTGYSVQEKYWDDNRKKIKRGCNTVPDTVSCNYYLKKKEVELMKKIREMDSKGILAGMTVKELKKELTDTPRKRKEKSFIKFTKTVIEELKLFYPEGHREHFQERKRIAIVQTFIIFADFNHVLVIRLPAPHVQFFGLNVPGFITQHASQKPFLQ